MPSGFKGTFVSAEPFDKRSESRHTLGCGTCGACWTCGGQSRGRVPRGERIEFSPQRRFRLREQFGEPPLNPACRSNSQVRLDAVDNQTFPGQAVGGGKRLDRLSILEGRARCGCVGLCQQLLHGLPGLRQIAGAKESIDGGPQGDDGRRRRTAQGHGLAPQRRRLGEVALQRKQQRGGHDTGGHAARLQCMGLPHRRDAFHDPALIEVQLAAPQERPRVMGIGLERRFDP